MSTPSIESIPSMEERAAIPAKDAHRATSLGRMTLRMIGYAAVLFFILGPLTSLMLWSVAQKWFWPHALPSEWGFKYWAKVFEGKMVHALSLSFGIAIAVTLLCLLISVPVSYWIARYRVPGRSVLLLLFLLPQAFPQLPVFTNAMELMYRWDLVGTKTGLILIHLVGAVVFCVWTMVSVFHSISPALEDAAVNLGASKSRMFFTITLPLSVPGMIAAALLVFLYSLDEFTGSLLIGAPFQLTMPVFMYNAAMGYEMQVASVTAILLMVPGIVLLLLLQRFMRSEYLSAFGRV